ncbi:hypothetical protein [Photobacterium sp. TY1-4]|nr:hypothetical protein [Photobacterium sp. TY1-4]UXI01829.1 hypothetical protein NH461_03100 [Photobacterium sp. TY1-4]
MLTPSGTLLARYAGSQEGRNEQDIGSGSETGWQEEPRTAPGWCFKE